MLKRTLIASSLLLAGFANAADSKVDVNIDNIRTVETHLQFERYQHFAGGVNTWFHFRDVTPIDKQSTIAMNRDTLYSVAMMDLSQPVTVTIPELEGRPLWLQIIDEDHYSFEEYTEGGQYTFTQEEVGTRYALAVVRTFVDAESPADIAAVNQLQDQFVVDAGSHVPFARPDYDMETYQALFDQLQPLIAFAHDSAGTMGKRGEVDEVKHLIATISGWGLLPPSRAMYEPLTPNLPADGTYTIDVPADVPVNGFWSISMYGADGFFHANEFDAYSINGVTADYNDDGSVTIQLGGCEAETPNCLPIAGEAWYYQWRMYDPGEAFRTGEFEFNKPVAKG